MMNSNTRSKPSTHFLVASVLVGFGFATAAFAETVYIWRDDNGVRQYSYECPTGETCRTREIGSMTTKRQQKIRNSIESTTADSTTTDTSTTSSSSGTSSSGTTVDTTSTSGTTTTNDTTAGTTTEPTTDPTGDTTTAGDTTTNTATDNTALLEWDAVNDPSLGGYRVYHAIAGAYYPAQGSGVNVGNSTSYTVAGLDSGTRYYFRVTAFDSKGNESGFSNEVYKDIP